MRVFFFQFLLILKIWMIYSNYWTRFVDRLEIKKMFLKWLKINKYIK